MRWYVCLDIFSLRRLERVASTLYKFKDPSCFAFFFSFEYNISGVINFCTYIYKISHDKNADAQKSTRDCMQIRCFFPWSAIPRSEKKRSLLFIPLYERIYSTHYVVHGAIDVCGVVCSILLPKRITDEIFLFLGTDIYFANDDILFNTMLIYFLIHDISNQRETLKGPPSS